METDQDILDFINTVKKNNIKEYAKILLDDFDRKCTDPILVEELWAPKVCDFLNILKNI